MPRGEGTGRGNGPQAPEGAPAWTMPAPGEVRMVENSFIPMSDGVRLAAQLWLPADAEARPAPVVVEYIPYRKRDRYRAYGVYWGETLARRGIAYARLETRGTGDSTGVLADEYLPVEQRDGAEAIAWLAAQPWCSGAVGMRGVSWGGFSALQTAALAPPALKALMPMCASDMRFTDDAHFIGGAFALTGLKWATSMKLVMAGPPDPLITGETWREEWRRRLEATPAIAARWLSHPSNDAYWRQGSVGLDWDAIRCPVYVIGGLADPYGALIGRLLEHLKGPRKGLLGPWRHGYPSPASPGPALDWAFEEVRWWRHWLMNEATGIMEEPMLRTFMPDATASQVSPAPIPGRWTAEPAWPSPNVSARTLWFGRGGLHAARQPPETLDLDGRGLVGLGKIEWVPFAPTELPGEQSPDDARSAVFETGPLAAPVEILGAPTLAVRLAADRPIAHLAVRLCEVTASGESWLVSHGLLNLTHRQGHERPLALEPGELFEVVIPLGFIAHRFAAGSRIRAALSPSLWPLVWPPPETPLLSIELAQTRLDLPVRTPPPAEPPMPIAAAAPAREAPEGWPVLAIAESGDLVEVSETWPQSAGHLAEIDMNLSGSGPNLALSMTIGAPLSCVWTAEQSAAYSRPGWALALRSRVSVRSDAGAFHVEERTEASLNGETVADVTHVSAIPRRLG